MPDCNHKWQGNADGVKCTVCGKTLTHDEYVALTRQDKPEKATKKETKT